MSREFFHHRDTEGTENAHKKKIVNLFSVLSVLLW
jgi:hypothetical protein